MMIELDNDELEIVRNLIEERLRELGPEIHHTRTADYRDSLKSLRRKLEQLAERLGCPTQ